MQICSLKDIEAKGDSLEDPEAKGEPLKHAAVLEGIYGLRVASVARAVAFQQNPADMLEKGDGSKCRISHVYCQYFQTLDSYNYFM